MRQNTVPVTESTSPANDNFTAAADALLRLVVYDEADEPTEHINDAEVWGTLTGEIANLPIAISTASGREAREWKTHAEARFGDLIQTVFSKHLAGKKDGNSIVTGTLGPSKRRTKQNVLANYLLGLDVDSGASMEETFQTVREMGLTAIFYTTFNHGTPEVEIAYDKFHRWATKSALSTEPTDELVRRYMREESNYVADACDSAEFVKKTHEDGMKIVVRTKPIDKFRILFPLEKPFVYAQQNGAHKDVIQLWESKVLGMGRSLGIEIDRVARDPSRLFYLPRHSKGSTNHRIMLTCGRLLRIEDIPSANVRERVSNDPFDRAAHALGGTSGKSGSLEKWARERAAGFDIASLFRDHCEDRIRETQTTEKLTTDCPYDDDHSNPGDPEDKGTFVQSAGQDAETFAFRCSHNGCAGRDRLDMLVKAIELEWFPAAALWDGAYFDDPDGDAESASNDAPIAIDAQGNLTFHSKRTKFKRKQREGRDWFYGPDSEGNDVAACQAFRVTHVASDTAGDGAAITIQFQPRHGETTEGTFTRAELYKDRMEVLGRLVGKWFSVANEKVTLDLLKALELPIDTLIVDRTGWHEGAYLHPSGATLPATGARAGGAKKMRLRGGAPAGDWRGGTLDGWQAAVAPAFDNDAHGREQFALGVMAGCAGVVAGFVGMSGFPILNLHGNTSRGKSTALMLAASASAAAIERGAYQSLRKTDNGMESILSARSGITIAFDEGKTTNADALESTIWMMAHGAGKTRATVTGDARAGREFCGFAMTANEVPLAQMLAQARKTQPGGFHARVCDVDVSGVPELAGADKDRFFSAFAEIKQHYGQAWKPVARHLQTVGSEHVTSELDRLAKSLAGPDADSFTARSAMTLALVWYSGIIMQELGLIPACDLARVARWAWGTRAVESTLDPFTRAMETLLTNVATRRGLDILEWDNPEPGRLFREAAAFIFMNVTEELLLVPRDRLADLCGGHMSGGMIRDQMKARAMLALSGKKDPKPRWSKLPDEQPLPHYRIKLSELAKFAGD
ncbi:MULTISPECIES: DUF927 domain-containing protein [unclassified Mesorhizobium]|uniref:DUF927 domain-containing protein n=1 Tax=unclassified Mesorhizobium TaxID=325217 RepID=UPI000FCA6973|nr:MULTISPECIES: DUF927 domain-containing protein [unclassified Mesorhizobium]TGU56912.1 DUF927 domain-containing protein [Mesorhizobium sp. M2D.F.Ca.ET.148.01.1.1]TGU61293.1 DUF927 domain-containing protein [Mesorhizobium sp. M2D.F.Ca.ET.147.01.1.1]